MQSLLRAISGVVLFGLILSGWLAAQQKRFNQEPRRTEQTQMTYTRAIQQGLREVKLWMNNKLVLGATALSNAQWDGSPPAQYCGSAIGLNYPESACIEHLYRAGPMIGGSIDGVRYVSYAAHDPWNENFRPSKSDTTRNIIWQTSRKDSFLNPTRFGYYKREPNRRFNDDDGDRLIDEDELDGYDNDSDWVQATDDLGVDGLPDSLETGCLGNYNRLTNPDPAGDNFDPSYEDTCYFITTNKKRLKDNKDIYTQGNGIPDHGEPHVDEDYGAYSDRDIYITATDTENISSGSNFKPLGIKIIMKSYAFDLDWFAQILPFEYSFINIGEKVIRDIYIGFYADMDIGPVGVGNYTTNNYSGYIENIRLAYSLNPVDRGSTPLGIILLDENYKVNNYKYVFQPFYFDPPCGSDSIDNLYRCISCEAFEEFPGDNSHCIKQDTLKNLNDTRFVYSFGPFEELSPGDTLKVVMGLVVADRLSDLEERAKLLIRRSKCEDCLPVAPSSPYLEVSLEEPGVRLTWGRREGYPDPYETWDDSNKLVESLPPDHWRRVNPPAKHKKGGRIFEGYRLYRSEDPDLSYESFAFIRQFDLDDEFDYNTGFDTTFVDSFVRVGNTYWYAVTSLSIPDIRVYSYTYQGYTHTDTFSTERRESYLRENVKKIFVHHTVSHRLGEVKVVPNPYRGDVYYVDREGYEGSYDRWNPGKRLVRFIHLPPKATIRIYTLAGEIIRTFQHDDETGIPGQEDFHLYSESGKLLAAGIFIFTVESDYGKQIGKFVVIQ